jgi:molybdenum cofactor guanylyltransferase
VLGAVLAGGRGSRMGEGGGGKATVELAGRPLATYPAAALLSVCDRVAVVCKPNTRLPALRGVERWEEPPEPRHPVTGIIHALERAKEAVLVCAVDMPLVTPEACRSLLTVAARSAGRATVAVDGEVLQPVFAVYPRTALDRFRTAATDAPLTGIVQDLDPVRVALPGRLLRSVNTPADIAAAEHALRESGAVTA